MGWIIGFLIFLNWLAWNIWLLVAAVYKKILPQTILSEYLKRHNIGKVGRVILIVLLTILYLPVTLGIYLFIILMFIIFIILGIVEKGLKL